MPEIVEVKLLADSLNRYLKNHIVIWIANPKATKKYKKFWPQVAKKKFKVLQVHQKGKTLIFDLQDIKTGQLIWVINELRMTGRWSKETGDHEWFQLIVSGKDPLWYTDVRGFGLFDYYAHEKDYLVKMDQRGPDILSEVKNAEQFVQRMQTKPRWQIVKALVDQSLVSGIGNWIKSDALYKAKIDPRTRVMDLSTKQLTKLYRAVMSVIKTSLKLKGSIGYVGFNGKRGGYKFLIYKHKHVKEGEVKTIKLTDGRTTHWVPTMFKK